jgi:hypothetical protein
MFFKVTAPEMIKSRFWIIIGIAFALRISSVSFGLPFLYHADEPIIVNHALAFGAGDLNPHFFKIPPLISYLLFFCYGVYFLLGRIFGYFQTIQSFEYLFYTNPSSFYLIARIVFGGLAGTASVAMLYQTVRKNFDETLAWGSAFLFAVCFLHVRDSHYIYCDIPLVFCMLLAWNPLFRVVEKKASLKDHLFIGALIGTATAIKYNGVSLGAGYLASMILSANKPKWRDVGLVFLSSFLVFSLLNPYWFLDFAAFANEVLTQNHSMNGVGWLHHFCYSLAGAAGLPVLAAASLAILLRLSARKQDKKVFLLIVFTLVYYALISLKGQPYDRYVLPLTPFLCFFAADFCRSVTEIIKTKKRFIFSVTLLLLAIPSLLRCFLWDRIMAAQDVRTQAKVWSEAHLPAESKLAIDWEFYMPRLNFSKSQLLEKRDILGKRLFSESQNHRLYYLISKADSQINYSLHFLRKETDEDEKRFLFSTPSISFDFKELKKKGIQYVFLARLSPTEDPEKKAFREELQQKGKLINRITPFKASSQQASNDFQPLTGGPFLWEDLQSRNSNGVVIEIYKLPS